MKECYVTSFLKTSSCKHEIFFPSGPPPPTKKKYSKKRVQKFLDLFVTIYFPVYIFCEDRGWWSLHQCCESRSEGSWLQPPSNILLERSSRHRFLYTIGNRHSQGKAVYAGSRLQILCKCRIVDCKIGWSSTR